MHNKEKNINHNQWRLDTSLSTGRPSSSSFISWQDSSSTEHQLSRYPGFWSQDGYQGFWGHPTPMPSQHRRDHPYGDRADQHQQQRARADYHPSSTQQYYQQPSLETIREEQAPRHHREREQRHQPARSWHHQDLQQERRWQNNTWHGWYYHPRQPQHQDIDLASQRPMGAGREWDSYILQRQRDQLSSERSSSSHTSASTWARRQDGGHRARIHLNIFHLEASWHVATWSSSSLKMSAIILEASWHVATWSSSSTKMSAIILEASWHVITWSSSSTKMSAIILPGDPADHHDLLPDILSQTITYILTINLPRVELRSHLAAALHAVPPGVAHRSQNNIRVVMHCLDQQPSPRQHHQELIQFLRYHLREHRAFVGHAAFTIKDTYTLLATACQCYIDQLPPRQPAGAIEHRAQGESTSSSSTSSSNIGHQEPHLHIGMIYINDRQEKDHQVLTANGHQPSHQPKIIYDITGEELTSLLEYDIKNENQEEIESTPSAHHVPRRGIWQNPHRDKQGLKTSIGQLHSTSCHC